VSSLGLDHSWERDSIFRITTTTDITKKMSHPSSSTPSTSTTSSSSSAYDEDSMVKTKKLQQETCDGYVTAGLTGNTTIQFLIQNLVDMGCSPPAGFIQCMDCEGKPVSGGFGMLQEEVSSSSTTTPKEEEQTIRKRPDCTKSRQEILDQFQRDKDGTTKLYLKPEIYLCQEHVTGPKHASTILAHELIHAIDMCRAKMDPIRNCMQLACTEIRAENLSGECNMSWEFLRAKLNSFWGHGKECVRRRAIDSVKANPNCTAKAELYVDAAMERCYADTFPFERHPNQR
jgi:inner membrane protease ATP23